ncbi:MAG: Holliday junction resolvase RuvX [Alphaproteobacteria bacterium]|nr:Holliday junction resolvase RuvX [Alphaproteobacteria bacterium]
MEPHKPLASVALLAARLGGEQRVLGLDVGTKTIGMALSDVGRTVATPLATLKRGRFRDDAAALRRLIEERGVGAIVVGLPINMDGSEGPRCQSVRQFAANLLAVVDRPLAFWDERLSTRAVERLLIEADVSRRRRAALNDKLAAAWILQGALDAMGRS